MTNSKKKYTLLPEHKARFPEWQNKWIANAMSTKPMDDDDRAQMKAAIVGMYQAAGLEPPPEHRIVFVPSPFVARFASGFASWIWHQRDATSVATHDATYGATRDATRDATSDATDDATHVATRDATHVATRDATYGATDDATRDATSDATSDATDDATHVATRDATSGATHGATYGATDDATHVATSDATYGATRVATRDATYGATDGATDDATHVATSDATYGATRVATRGAKWFRLGGCSERDMSDLAERILPGHRRGMLECATKAWRMANGGNQWSGWVAFLSFFRYVAELPIDYSAWEHYEKAAVHAGPRYTHAKFCIVSDRPEVLLVDEQNRPHCTTGPFCRWRDGSALYAVHGVRVPWTVIEQRDKITVSQVDAEPNTEVRRVMLELYGEARYLQDSGAKPVHTDSFGTLYRKEIPGDETLVMVRVLNSTSEPDGSFKPYFLRVPPTIKTAHEAVAWSFGVEAKDYKPQIES
jgi:hypothetical protein